MDGSVDALGQELVLQLVTPPISANDSAHLPEPQIVQKLTTRDSYLANDQLVDVVGGYAFFGFLVTRLPFGSLSSGSSDGTA